MEEDEYEFPNTNRFLDTITHRELVIFAPGKILSSLTPQVHSHPKESYDTRATARCFNFVTKPVTVSCTPITLLQGIFITIALAGQRIIGVTP